MYVYYVEYADSNLATLAKTLDTAFHATGGHLWVRGPRLPNSNCRE